MLTQDYSFMRNNLYHSKNLAEHKFLITGGAGFIGSHIVRYLLNNGAGKVRVLDNFSTGFFKNIEEFTTNAAFELIEGDIRNLQTCVEAIDGITFISHQAALGSIPRSIADPLTSNGVNVDGFLNLLYAAKESGMVDRLVYASSSSVYGDNNDNVKIEDNTGRLLSPYAATKHINELYGHMFAELYGLQTIGLRYFNVFGPKQNPEGAYAAVIPRFIKAAKNLTPATIYGDGMQSRDFTFVDNVVQANVRAFFVDDEEAVNQIYNIGCGEKTSVNQLLDKICALTSCSKNVVYEQSRTGDVRNSLADISKAKRYIGYEPVVAIDEGLKQTIYSWG